MLVLSIRQPYAELILRGSDIMFARTSSISRGSMR
jgi:hypothetical protein